MKTVFSLALVLLVAASPVAARDSGVQVTPDGRQTLVNKDVGNERWAIARNVDDGSVTGNVFRGEEDPLYVWCEEVSRAGNEVTLDCFGADQCPEAPCTPEAWPFVSRVTVPVEFFEPPVAGGCEDDGGCSGGEFCEFPRGECGGEGACVESPGACTREFDPVCGCDGMSYTNPCEAASAGASIAKSGFCDAQCGGFAGLQCEDGQFCDLGVGGCLISDAAGECKSPSGLCTDVYVPVCGCDGKTYGNGCVAAAEGQNIAAEGPCKTECESNADCSAEQYCERDGNSCAGAGECVERPRSCTFEIDPVCGCDGETYPTACAAAAEGVGVAHDGECLEELAICGGIAGLVCAPDQYCAMPLGVCLIPDATGECAPGPESCICPLVIDPVCGCDGQSYDNACQAECAGQSVATVGVCA